MCYQCGGTDAWRLGPGEPARITLPASIGQYYSYSHVTDQIAYAQTFADHGAGPGNLAVSDLSLLNVTTGEVTPIYPDDVIEALWSPDGTRLAYILATSTTYELRVREPDGSDRLLASDVSLTWGFSPSGDMIAFTRESGYETPGTPGLYVVSLASGTEIQVSDVDKSGTGSIDDRPFWTQYGQFVTLCHYGGPSAPRVVLAAADGSDSWDITVDESLSANWWYTPSITAVLWYPDGERALALPGASQEMGGPPPLVLFSYDRATHTFVEGTEIGTVNTIIGWDIPGESFWVVAAGGDVERMSAP
jgi:Tol biopolymer transport system component